MPSKFATLDAILMSSYLGILESNHVGQVSGGNLSDEEVCGKITDHWLEERLASQEGLQV